MMQDTTNVDVSCRSSMEKQFPVASVPSTVDTTSNESSSCTYLPDQKLCLLDTIAHVQRQYMQSECSKVVFGGLLEALLDLMDSEYGFIGEIKYEADGTMFLQTHAVTNIAWDAATRQFYEDNAASGLKFYNLNTLFGKVMTSHKPVISNNPSKETPGTGIPKGHPPLDYFLGIPFFKTGGEIVGMIGVANKPGGYRQSDIDFLEPFTVTCSNLIQAYCQKRLNNELIVNLEEKVKERTRELENVNQSLEEANRRVMEASAAQLKHFACMSHEIRTPLNCIIGFSSLLQESEMTPMQAESVRMIATSGDLLLTVVNDVLDYSKLESGNVDIEIKRSSLQETLDATVHSIETKAAVKNVTVATKYDPAVPEFMETDSRRLQQIMYNLLGNAVKFSPDGGTVEVAASVVKKHGCMAASTAAEQPTATDGVGKSTIDGTSSRCPFARSSQSEKQTTCPFQRSSETSGQSCPYRAPTASLANRCLRLSVKDYGQGIKRQDFDRIFKPFKQVEGSGSVYGGTGLGLAITHKLVKALGGTIRVDSEVGKYAKFIVELPLPEEPFRVGMACRKLSQATILFLGSKEPQREGFKTPCGLKYTAFSDRQDLIVSIARRRIAGDGRYILVADEELYTDQFFEAICESFAQKPALVTFGPRFAKPEESVAHFRALDRVLPSVMLQTLIGCVTADNSTNAGRPNGTTEVESNPEAAASTNYTSSKILIAEDNVINQKVLARMLKKLGFEHFDIVDDGAKAVEREAVEQYDIVLMDMQMPVMDGMEACRRIVERHAAIGKSSPADSTMHGPVVVFVTAHVSQAFEQECRQIGGSAFLPKPFNLKGIDKCLQQMHALVQKKAD